MRKARSIMLAALLLLPGLASAETQGFFAQKFSDLHFEKSRWTRATQLPCQTYTALVDGALVNVLRVGLSDFVHFKARKGLTVTVCGSVASFDEGFETDLPRPGP